MITNMNLSTKYIKKENMLQILEKKYSKIMEEIEIVRRQKNEDDDIVKEVLVDKEEASRSKLISILKIGELAYDYLKSENWTNLGISDLEDHVERLVDYLVKDKQYLDEKYKKLLDLHNNLIESNEESSAYNTPEYIYKITDENDLLKEELRKLREENLRLKTKFYKINNEELSLR